MGFLYSDSDADTVPHNENSSRSTSSQSESESQLEMIRKEPKDSQEKNLFRCSSCSAPFRCQFEFQEHLLNHLDVEFQFDVKMDPDRNRNVNFRKAKPPNYKCRFCSMPFRVHFSLNEHEKFHSDMEQFIPLPRTQFLQDYTTHKSNSKSTMKADKFQKSTIRSRSNKEDSANYRNLPELESGSTHIRTGPFLCTAKNCQSSFSRLTSLTSHQKIKHFKELGLKSFRCTSCGEEFGQNFLLKRHTSSCSVPQFK